MFRLRLGKIKETRAPERRETKAPLSRPALIPEDQYVEQVMKATGLTMEETVSMMEKARICLGVSYLDFARYEFFNIPEDEQEKAYEAIRAAKEVRKAQKLEDELRYIPMVMKRTGWTEEQAVREMNSARDLTGANYEHFYMYHFWELSDEERKSYYSYDNSFALRTILNTDPRTIAELSNKNYFNEKYAGYIGRKWLTTQNMTWDGFRETFDGIGKIIYKPLNLSGGRGAETFELEGDNMRRAYDVISALPPGMIEEYIIQHPQMSKLSLNAVNTVRVVTIRLKEDLPGVRKDVVHVPYCTARMGTGNNCVDNLHSNGMVAAIDMETGTIVTDAVDGHGEAHAIHPDTGEKIKGFKIPYFREAVDLIKRAAELTYGYYGWDVAITEKGPVIIEANTNPGADLVQLPYVPTKEGKACVMKKYYPADRTPELPAPSDLKVTGITDEGISLSWKKQKQAGGYVILRSYEEDGAYEEVLRMTKGSASEAADSSFDKSREKVFYKIRSFCQRPEGVLTFSGDSEAVTALPIEGLRTELDTIYMYSGTAVKLKAWYGWGETEGITWTSEDESLAVIEDSMIRALRKGEGLIRLRMEERGLSAEVKLVVDREAKAPATKHGSDYLWDNGIYKYKKKGKSREAVIMLAGNLMCSRNQAVSLRSEDGAYRFSGSFKFAPLVTDKADLALASLDPVFCDGLPKAEEQAELDGSVNHNAPAEYLEAVREGGFDGVIFDSDNAASLGARGLMESRANIERNGLIFAGRGEDEDSRLAVAEINGLRIALISLNCPVYETAEVLRPLIAKAGEKGACYIITYICWGSRSKELPSDLQKVQARMAADLGADYIVGTGNRVIQPFEIITALDGRQVPLAYALGNFQSSQRKTDSNRESIAVMLHLKMDRAGRITVESNKYVPFYIYPSLDGAKWVPAPLSESYNTGVRLKDRDDIEDNIADEVGDLIEQE